MMTTSLSGRDPYEYIAELYDLEHDEFVDDLELLQQLADESPGPLLEMGCGSGRILVPLAESGYTSTGIDLSQPMLARARNRARASEVDIVLHELAMERVSSVEGGPFGMVMFTLNALTHLDNQADQLAALEGSLAILRPGGTLFLDLPNPMPDYLTRLSETKVLEWSGELADGTTIDKWAYRTIDPISQLIDTRIWYDHISPSGDTRSVRTAFTLRYLHHGELVQLLERAGYEHISMFGSYMLDPLEPESDRMLVTAVKP
jgi:SAM-dependent methyltransferase